MEDSFDIQDFEDKYDTGSSKGKEDEVYSF